MNICLKKYVRGFSNPKLNTDTPIYSLHDFDLGISLKLLKKIDLIDSVKIIGVPMKIGEDKAIE